MSQTQAIRLPRHITCPAADRRQVACSGSGVAVCPAQRFTTRPARDYGSGSVQSRLQARDPSVPLPYRHRNLRTVPGRLMQGRLRTWSQIAQDVAAERAATQAPAPVPAPAQVAEARIAAGGIELMRRIRDLAGELDGQARRHTHLANTPTCPIDMQAMQVHLGQSQAYRHAAALLRQLVRP